MIDEESLKSIERLHQLKNDGVITAEDFDAAKAKLLQGGQRTAGRTALIPKEVNSTLPADDDHMAWVLLPLRRYTDFTGRSTRKEFWMFHGQWGDDFHLETLPPIRIA